MKLKNVLILAFLVLTLIPIALVSVLLYKSGIDLSKASYTRNMKESINVQADYISQTLETDMIAEYRFVNQNITTDANEDVTKEDVYEVFQAYLQASEDKIVASLFLDKDNNLLYSTGEQRILELVSEQVTNTAEQSILEFNLGHGNYSLGIVTPARDDQNNYIGSLVSVYDKSYIFKIISSYYEISDTSTYICRENGTAVNSRGVLEGNESIERILKKMTFESEGEIDMHIEETAVSGVYRNIHNTPWYLAGFVDHKLVFSFTNRFIWIYIVIISGVLAADLVLAFYFSHKVVQPINNLIKVMEGYQNSLDSKALQYKENGGYYETKYLNTKFLSLMKTILLVQHNFEGIYQLYQSSSMGDINIDIDVKRQSIQSNKDVFQKLMDKIEVPEKACIVERFVNCFCEKDRDALMKMFESMRDEHLSVTSEAEVYTPHLNQRWFHTLVVPMYEDDRLSRLFIQLRDISSFKRQERESLEQARRDPLTRLYNRNGFAERVSAAMKLCGTVQMHGLLFIDMNHFKLVNDNLGHDAGDELLRSVARVLEETIEPEDIASRIGGDEFAVFLFHTSEDKLEEVRRKLNRHLVYPFALENNSFEVSASIGAAMWSDSSKYTLEQILKLADEEMYRIKRAFKDKK